MNGTTVPPTGDRKVVVIGGGIIGLSCAWRLAGAGHAVTVLDPAAGSGATHAAAGMIAPASEATFGQDSLLDVSLASAALWPSFAADLARDAGSPVPLSPGGTLLVALDADDDAALERHAAHLNGRGCSGERLTSREARRLEPALSPRVTGALRLDETAVDPRTVTSALQTALARRGGTILAARGEPVLRGGVAVGVRPVDETGSAVGTDIASDVVVVAAGWRSPQLLSSLGSSSATSVATALPVRPLKGQILRLAAPPGTLGHTVRATVRGREVYLVPRPEGEVVVGATSEDVGEDLRVTAGAVHDLLHDAIEVVPELCEATLRESTARLRPATPDNLPIVGPTGDIDGLVLAAGHGRDGVLLAPITGDVVLAHVEGRIPAAAAEVLSPQRLLPQPLPPQRLCSAKEPS